MVKAQVVRSHRYTAPRGGKGTNVNWAAERAASSDRNQKGYFLFGNNVEHVGNERSLFDVHVRCVRDDGRCRDHYQFGLADLGDPQTTLDFVSI